MLLEAEIGLMLAVVGLYLYDSALLLYGNEGVVSAVGRSRWSVGFASSITLRGRNLFIPSPLFPHRPIFRLAWNPQAGAAAADPAWTERRALFRPLAPFVWGMLVAIFVLLPLGLFSRLGDAMVLAAFALLYANILVLLGWLALRRARYGLSGGRLARLAFEVLVCSPFALNLVRKLSTEMPVDEDLVRAARRLQPAEQWHASRKQILLRIDEELDFEAEDSGRSAALKALRGELAREEAA